MTASADSDRHALTAANDSGRSPKIDRPTPAPRSRYRRFVPLATRWTDNDAYGHLNNVVYLSLFDSAVNAELVAAGALDIEHGAVIGLVVETGCHFFSSVAFPQALEAGLAVARIGRTSVSYEIGIFAAGAPETAAHGRFVHVYVDRRTRRPVPLPDRLLAFVKALQ
jgi:acyl-CoA thioester hydrolase